jgi:hypothetical protein
MAINRKDIEDCFSLLLDVVAGYSLLDKPGHVYNMAESGFQMNRRPDAVTAEKGSPTLCQVMTGEKGETVPVMAYCTVEGFFLYLQPEHLNVRPEGGGHQNGNHIHAVVKRTRCSKKTNREISANVRWAHIALH